MAGVYYHNLLYFCIPYAKIIRKFHKNCCKDRDALIEQSTLLTFQKFFNTNFLNNKISYRTLILYACITNVIACMLHAIIGFIYM